MRAFIAVQFADEVREAVAAAGAALCGGDRAFRLISPKSLHLTLQFLGEVQEERADTIAVALAAGVAGCSPFPIEIAASGAFPSTRRARVVWVGIHEGAPRLIELARRVEMSLAPLGWRPDKPFAPHVTVARARGIARLDKALSEKDSIAAQQVDSIHLMESVLSRSGAEYRSRARIELR